MSDALPTRISKNSLALLVLLVGFVIQLCSPQHFDRFYGDDYGNLLTVRALVEDHSLDLRHQLQLEKVDGSGFVALGRDGELFSVHEQLLSIVGAPFYYLLGDAGLNLVYIGIISIAVIALVDIGLTLATPIAVFIATSWISVKLIPLFSFQNDLFATCIFVVAIWTSYRKHFIMSGIFAGLLPLARLPFAPLALLPLLLIFDRKRMGPTFTWSLSLLPGFAILLGLNQLQFGSPFTFSYFRQAYYTSESVSLVDMRLVHFHGEILTGLSRILFSNPSGFLLRNPMTPLAILVGLPLMARYKPRLTAIVLLCHLILLSVFVRHRELDFGLSRYFLPAEFLYALPLVVALDQLANYLKNRIANAA